MRGHARGPTAALSEIRSVSLAGESKRVRLNDNAVRGTRPSRAHCSNETDNAALSSSYARALVAVVSAETRCTRAREPRICAVLLLLTTICRCDSPRGYEFTGDGTIEVCYMIGNHVINNDNNKNNSKQLKKKIETYGKRTHTVVT